MLYREGRRHVTEKIAKRPNPQKNQRARKKQKFSYMVEDSSIDTETKTSDTDEESKDTRSNDEFPKDKDVWTAKGRLYLLSIKE